MFFETLETDLKTRLIAKLGAQVEVESLPEKEIDYMKPFAKPRVTIAYENSEFSEPMSTNEIHQEEKQLVEILIMARALRGANSIYSVFDQVRKAIIGFRGTHTKKIYARSFTFKNRVDNIWIYSFLVVCPTVMVEEVDEVADPNGTQITLQNSDGNYGNVQVSS